MTGVMMIAAGNNSSGSAPAASYITPATVSKVRAGAGDVTTNAATMAPAATYTWSWVSGDTFTINAPAAQTTTFSATLADGDVLSGRYQCVTATPTQTGYVTVTARSTSTL